MRKIGLYISVILYSFLFLIPLILVLSNADFKVITGLFKDSYYRHVILFTFEQALLSTVLSLIFGIPGAYIVSKYKFKFRKFVKLIYYIPFVLPSILVVLGFVTTYGKSGLVYQIFKTDSNILYSFKAIMLAHVFYNFPVVCSIVSNKWESLDKNIEDEARSAGASELIVFKRITIPRLMPAIISSSLLVFLFCFTSFAIILVLGGGPKYSTIEVEIYRQARTSLNIVKASSLSIVSLLSATTLIFFYNILMNKNKDEELTDFKLSNLNEEKSVSKFLCYLYITLSVIFLAFPIVGIMYKVISSNIIKGFNIQAVLNTFTIGCLSSVISILIAVFICSWLRTLNNNLYETLFILPMATSSVILGLGYFIITKYVNVLPDFILLTLCHSVLNFPYAVRNILPIYRSLPKEQVESAQIDGLNDAGILLKIDLPYIKNTLLTSFAFCFALSCGELNATVMIASGKYVTLPLQIQRMISAYNFDGACAAGLALIVMCSFVYLICEKLKDH